MADDPALRVIAADLASKRALVVHVPSVEELARRVAMTSPVQPNLP